MNKKETNEKRTPLELSEIILKKTEALESGLADAIRIIELHDPNNPKLQKLYKLLR